MKRTIAVVTSSRADYGHLYWPLMLLRDHPDVTLRLMVTGGHLSPEFGATATVIESDGFAIDDRIECLQSSDTRAAMGRAIGVGTLGFTDALERNTPDLLVIIADRYEMLAPACAALALRIPIVHIEGGDASEGAIDQAIRNALTMMSHVHLAPTALAARRLLAMGEEAWRIHQTGAPSLDHLRRTALHSPAAIRAELDLDAERPIVVCAYHPVTLDRDPTAEVDAVLAGLTDDSVQHVFCYPNADSGTRLMRQRVEAWCAARPHATILVNLDPTRYWSLLAAASAMAGNSSSGAMESTSLSLPAINIGPRQAGREHAANVVDVAPTRAAVASALAQVLDPAFRVSCADLVNPYGDGHAAERIVKAMAEVALDDRLLRKPAARV